MPVAADGPTTAGEMAADRRRFAAYSWLDAFAYPFRGNGAYVFWSFPAVIVVLSVVSQLPLVGLLGGCFQVLLSLAVLLVLPGALFAVVRTTAQGETELPEWPDFFDFGNRINEIFEFILIGMVALIPAGVGVRIAGCTDPDSLSAFCWVTLLLGCLLSMAIWVPAFGSVGVFRSFWLALRLDLHFRAIRDVPGPFGLILAAAVVLVAVGQSAAFALLAVVPLVGVAVSAVVGLYSWFTIAHLVGLWFRWHRSDLEAIYRG